MTQKLSSQEIKEYVDFIIEFRDDEYVKNLKLKSKKEYNELMCSTFENLD